MANRITSLWRHALHPLKSIPIKESIISDGMRVSFLPLSNNRIVQQSYAFKYNYAALGLPDPPKRPASPFISFMMSDTMKKEYEKNYQHLSRKEYLKKVSEFWNQLSPEAKLPYSQAFNESINAYKVENAEYLAKLSEEQISSIRQVKRKKAEKRKALKNKRLLKSLGKPVKPPSPFIFFSRERFQSKESDESPTAFMSKISKEWRDASSEMKKVYYNRYHESVKDYKMELQKWELSMIDQGLGDVVQSRPQPTLKKVTQSLPTQEKS